jgi:hypothetical protein
MSLDKESSIVEVLDRLQARLGPDTFAIVDHWDCDRRAVGVARPDDHGVLAYIATWGSGFYVELELPPPPGDDFPNAVAGQHSGLSAEQVVQIVAGHLSLSQPR